MERLQTQLSEAERQALAEKERAESCEKVLCDTRAQVEAVVEELAKRWDPRLAGHETPPIRFQYLL